MLLNYALKNKTENIYIQEKKTNLLIKLLINIYNKCKKMS